LSSSSSSFDGRRDTMSGGRSEMHMYKFIAGKPEGKIVDSRLMLKWVLNK
jgi:hypothetical protein